jgi:arylsulfatase
MTRLFIAFLIAFPATAWAQDVLPFPPTPSASKAGVTIETSVYQKRAEPERLPPDAPNILIVLIDDVGNGTPSTYGGEISTPTLSRIAEMGVSYNRFHSTAMCSPTRAALLTGRNHTRVGNGQIAAIANDFDGFSGVIPKTSATMAEVLKAYGYNTSAFGKWHNTPEDQITNKGPFDCWPTGYGFEYFYGFLAGEASQYEPTMVRNTSYVERPKTSGGNDHYHLSEDIADDAIIWLRDQKAYSPDKPFFMYWAPGASHGPHQVMKEWADRYKGKFDNGWDAYRERVFAKQKELGWIPANTKLTPRAESMASWDSIPEEERAFQRRMLKSAALSMSLSSKVGWTIRWCSTFGETTDLLPRDSMGRSASNSRRMALLPKSHSIWRHSRSSVDWTPLEVSRPITCTTPDGRGQAARPIKEPNCKVRISAAHASRWPYPGRKRYQPTRRPVRNSTMSWMSCQPFTSC